MLIEREAIFVNSLDILLELHYFSVALNFSLIITWESNYYLDDIEGDRMKYPSKVIRVELFRRKFDKRRRIFIHKKLINNWMHLWFSSLIFILTQIVSIQLLTLLFLHYKLIFFFICCCFRIFALFFGNWNGDDNLIN